MSEKILGTIVEVEGNYFLQTSGEKAARKKEMVKLGSATEKATYSKLVGQKAEVILSEPVRSVVAIAVTPKRPEFKCYFILCYIPVPFRVLPVMDRELIAPLAQQFLQEGILSKETFNKVMNMANM